MRTVDGSNEDALTRRVNMETSALKLACMKLRAQQIAEEKTRAEAAAIGEQRSPIAGASAQDGDYDDDEEIGGGQFDGANSLSAQLLAARDAYNNLKAKFVEMQAERDAYKNIVDSMQADVNEQVRLSQARLSRGSKPARGSKQPDRGDQGDAEADRVDARRSHRGSDQGPR